MPSTDTFPADRELVQTRLIDSPRASVFKAWTNPMLLEQDPAASSRREVKYLVRGSDPFAKDDSSCQRWADEYEGTKKKMIASCRS
jgi:hypothetical protein